jgi:hypothetical protein
MNNGLKCFIVVYILMQPSQYINTLLVPRNSKISVDVDCLPAQGIFDVVCLPNLFIMQNRVGIISLLFSVVNIFPEVFSLRFHVDMFMSRAGIFVFRK